MTVTIAVPKEIKAGEDRVAITPSVIDKLSKLGAKVKILQSAGLASYIADKDYKNVEVANTATELYANSDVVIKIQPPTTDEIKSMKDGTILITTLYPHTRPAILRELCEKKVTCFAMEMVPRISRAQPMDILSTQATVIGYMAVLIGATTYHSFLPMMSTGAGTIRPAKVLVIGIGVAGLQAIATAKRLGARVEAYDVRPETKQEAESLGAKFVDTGVKAVGEGGYARELTTEEKKIEQGVLAKHIAESDVVIATAGIPGRPAPKIISQQMVEMMKEGSVIVDTMAEMGGNCELAKAGEKIIHNGVTIVGTKNIASTLSTSASEMYAKNILNFITPLFKDGAINLDWNDEVVAGSAATHDGAVVNQAFKKLAEV